MRCHRPLPARMADRCVKQTEFNSKRSSLKAAFKCLPMTVAESRFRSIKVEVRPRFASKVTQNVIDTICCPMARVALRRRSIFPNWRGRQIELDIQLVGISGASGRIAFQEVASVPPSETQLAAAAIARQKICPVSGKPLGSMGQVVAVDLGGERVYVCCAGCVGAVNADPAKYAAGRPEITVTTATEADAALVNRQAKCPVMDEPLGSMGQPIKVMVGDKPIFLCCKGCIKKIQAEPAKYLAMVYGNRSSAQVPTQGGAAVVPAGMDQVRAGVFKVTAADAPFIAAQKRCPVMDEPLDAMGGPYKVNAAGKAIYICCPGCAKKIAAEPQKYLGILAQQGVNAPMLRSQK